MKKAIILIPLIFILLSFYVSAITIQLNGSNANSYYCNGWTEADRSTPKNCSLINLAANNVFATAGFSEGDAYWNFTNNYPGVTASSWEGYTGFGDNVNLPLGCYQQNPIQLKEWATFTCSFSCNGAFLDCYNGTGWQQLSAANGGNEYPNFIGQGAALNITYTNTSSLSCSLSCPGQYCIFHDDLSYNSSFQSCGYNLLPQDNTFSPANNLIYPNNFTQIDMQHSIYAAGYYNSIYDTYLINLQFPTGRATCNGNWDTGDGFLEHQLTYSDYTINTNKPAYDITFLGDISTHQVTGYSLMPDNSLQSFCANCFDPSISHKIEIYSFNSETPTNKFFNATSQQYQFYDANSYSVFIDGMPIAYNLPLANTLISGNSNHITLTDYYMSQCVETGAFDISGNLNQIPINTSTTPLKSNNDYCNSDADCISDYCIYGKCSGKSGGATCASSIQCLSGACNNGICSNPGAWETIDTGVKGLFGNNIMDTSLISIIIILLIGGALILATKGQVAGIVTSLGISLILLFFFTFAGWIAPFIFVACILFLLLGVLLFFVITQHPGGT